MLYNTNSYQFIGTKKSYDNLGSDIFVVLTQQYAISGCDITSYKVNVEKGRHFKFVGPPSSLTLIKMLGSDTIMTAEIAHTAKSICSNYDV